MNKAVQKCLKNTPRDSLNIGDKVFQLFCGSWTLIGQGCAGSEPCSIESKRNRSWADGPDTLFNPPDKHAINSKATHI